MNEPRVERRLAAILAADVAGYSRLMGADEEGTHAALKRCLSEVIDPRIAAHGGRIVKTTGDGLLIEYPSVLEALRSAIAMQREMAARNAAEPAETRIAFRIGINLGDVILDDSDIFGDGVNVAARLEALAEPGGIAVSGTVHDLVHNRFDMGFESLGAQRVKNIADPVRVYRLRLDGPAADSGWGAAMRRRLSGRGMALAVAAAALLAIAAGAVWMLARPLTAPGGDQTVSAGTMLPLPGKPSIAVLPFVDLDGASRSSPVGDGLADNLIAALSKIPGIFVIARNSSFIYKGRAVKVQEVARELGVRYVLEGSAQSAAGKVRVTARLIDATSGYPLWSERYDRAAKDIFALQDDITLNVVTALQIKLTDGELARVRRKGTNNLDAWLLVNQSLEAYQHFTREDNRRARLLARKALALDPAYPEAYIRLARTYLTDFQTGWVADREAALRKSIELVRKAVTLDDAYPDAYVILGAIHLFVNQHEDAVAYAEKALALSPNHSLARANLAMILNYAGYPDRAEAAVLAAMRLSPHYPDWFLGELGRARILAGRYDEAIEALRLRVARNPESGEGRILLAAAYGAAGRTEEARAQLDRFLEEHPGYTLRRYARGEYYRNPQDLNRVLDGLRKAGMPE